MTDRRTMLQAAAGFALAQAALAPAPSRAAAAITPGTSGEFDFLSGDWKIHHRRLKAPGQWDEFEGEATCWSILGGVASIEELRIPARNFSGMGMRILDRKGQRWGDYWMNSQSGVVAGEPTWGGFVNGDAVFVGDDEDAGKPIQVRGLWDGIKPGFHRWSQAVSRDGGKSWETNWWMEWRRA